MSDESALARWPLDEQRADDAIVRDLEPTRAGNRGVGRAGHVKAARDHRSHDVVDDVAVRAARDRVGTAQRQQELERTAAVRTLREELGGLDGEIECLRERLEGLDAADERAGHEPRRRLRSEPLAERGRLTTSALRQGTELVGLGPFGPVLRLRVADEVDPGHSGSPTSPRTSTSRGYVRSSRASESAKNPASSTSFAASRSPATGVMSQ